MTLTDKFQNAQMNLQVLRHELLKANLAEHANRLDGVEVCCPASAEAAIHVLKHLQLDAATPKAVVASRDWTIARLEATKDVATA